MMEGSISSSTVKKEETIYIDTVKLFTEVPSNILRGLCLGTVNFDLLWNTFDVLFYTDVTEPGVRRKNKNIK